MLIYLDSVILIYRLDFTGPFHQRAVNYLTDLFARGDRVAFSDLTRLECRVKPIKIGDGATLAQFDSFFLRPDVRLLPLTAAVYDRATHIRARHGFKLADALHLAAAVEHGCDRFATNDLRLSKFPDIQVEVLP